MSEQVIAALIGAAVVGGLKVVDRLLDWWFPTGHHAKKVDEYGVKDKEENDDEK